MDIKQRAAAEALNYIIPGSVIGLGAGSTIAHMARLLKAKYENIIPLHFCTSSFTTENLLRKLQVPVMSIDDVGAIDIYFDGCDELDADLNALKSGGGIHTAEKLFALQAKKFIIVGDDQKLVKSFTGKTPLVVEIMPLAEKYVIGQIQKIFAPQTIAKRMSPNTDGPVITRNGNYLLDLHFLNWPELRLLNTEMKMITGVIETSLFYKLVHMAIIGTASEVKIC